MTVMTVDKLTIDQMSVDEMSIDKMSWHQHHIGEKKNLTGKSEMREMDGISLSW
jgi:hypothetical protein